MIGRNKVNSGGRRICNARFATTRQRRMILIPDTSLTLTQASQVAIRASSFSANVNFPVVATTTWLMLTLYQRPIAIPAATATKAIASSKHGQSSTGSGWTKTSPKVSGIIEVGTMFPLFSRNDSNAGVRSMLAYQMAMPRTVPARQSGKTYGQRDCGNSDAVHSYLSCYACRNRFLFEGSVSSTYINEIPQTHCLRQQKGHKACTAQGRSSLSGWTRLRTYSASIIVQSRD